MADLSAAGLGDDVTLCRTLIHDQGVAAIPPSVFYSEDHKALGQGFLRFAFCKEDTTLREAARRLALLR